MCFFMSTSMPSVFYIMREMDHSNILGIPPELLRNFNHTQFHDLRIITLYRLSHALTRMYPSLL